MSISSLVLYLPKLILIGLKLSKSALHAVRTWDGKAIWELQADPVDIKILLPSRINSRASPFTPLKAILEVLGVLLSKSP